MTANRLFRQWVAANFIGWLLGFALVVALAAGTAVLIGLEGVQFYLGLGMGLGVGYAQARVAKSLWGATAHWGWACAAGLTTPFVVSDVVRALWGGLAYIPALFSNVAAGGLLVGFLQRPQLPSHGGRAAWWIAACAAGWVLAATTVAFYGFAGGWKALVSFAAMLLGGVILGAVTGGALVWMRRGAAEVGP